MAPDATAQIVPTPTLPTILPTQTPLPEPPGSGGDEEEEDDEEDPDGSEGDDGNDEAGNDATEDGDKKKGAKNRNRKKKNRNDGFVVGPVPSGTFTTDALVTAAAKLRSLGMPYEQVVQTVYPPFIIGGQAAWTNTWGAPRVGPGTLVRTHEGQDVFCRYGDPVLAPEAGLVSYSNGGLGGLVARVHTSKRSYWYLAHLSEINDEQYPLGSAVQVGDVIGLCGNSGNAKTTPPHVHFGHYVNGASVNPMADLVGWLRQAHKRAGLEVTKLEARRIASSDRLTVARRFGDAFTSDLSTLETAAGSLLETGVAASDGIAQAEKALQEAFSDIGGVPSAPTAPAPGSPGAKGPEPATAKEIYDVITDGAEGHD